MYIVGSPIKFLKELIPGYEHYLPDLFSLAVDVWPQVDLSGLEKIMETEISALYFLSLSDEIEARANVPFSVWAEIQDFDRTSGKQLTRSDIEFHPSNFDWRIHKRKPYLILECKCLRLIHQKKFRPNTSEYLAETKNFVDNTKDKHPAFCAMVGFVMDGKTQEAFDALQNSLSKSTDLGLSPLRCMSACAPLPHPPHGKTEHISTARKAGKVTIYHLLFPSPVPHLQP